MSPATPDAPSVPAPAGLDLRPRPKRNVPLPILTDREVSDALKALKQSSGRSVSLLCHEILRAALFPAAPVSTPTEDPTR